MLDPRSWLLLPTYWVGVSIMFLAETVVMVSPHSLWWHLRMSVDIFETVSGHNLVADDGHLETMVGLTSPCVFSFQ